MFSPRLRPLKGHGKVVRFMQNEPQFILYRAQRTNASTKGI